MDHDILIVCSITDRTLADTLASALETDGVRCEVASWNGSADTTLIHLMFPAMARSRIVVPILKTDSKVPRQVSRPMERVMRDGTAIIPLRGHFRSPSDAASRATEAGGPAMFSTARLNDLVRTLKMVLASQYAKGPLSPMANGMLPCRLEFASSSARGGDDLTSDPDVGELVLVYSDPHARHSEPVAYFPNHATFQSAVINIAALAAKFSGVEADALTLFATDASAIWLPTVDGYREQLLGKIKGCRCANRLPYGAYSFGFSPNSFFFDPNIIGGDPYSRERTMPSVLQDAKETITSVYRLLLVCDPSVPPPIQTSDFFLETCPSINADWLCWQCYFADIERNE